MGKGKKEKKPMDILAGSDDDSDSDGGGEDLSKIQINEEYARRFEHNKRREALQRLEDRKKQGLVPASSSDDEESSEEDDVDAIASHRVDRRVFDVIRRIRSGDPRILDKDAKVYSSSEDEAGEEGEEGKQEEPKQAKKAKKEKPMYLKDVNARHLLEEGPEFAAQTSRSSKYDRIAYDEQQKQGLEDFLEAQKEAIGSDDDDDDLFYEKPKAGQGSDDKEEDEEEKQVKELAGEVFGEDEELDENEKFLKDFFLKRPYLESGKENKPYLDDIQELSDEEDELEIQEDYEYAYNYRHEEAAALAAVLADRVMGHSRVVEGSVRKKESSRKQQRKSKEERIARAKQEQAEELKHLKNLKKKEIGEKLERIRMIAGIEGGAACKLGADDLEEDFDPEDYDRKMQEMFDDTYYEADDADPEFGNGEEMDLEKPDFDKEDELLGLPRGWAIDQSKEESTATDGKATKGKISLKDKVELEKEMEEYYKLDYEDTIGDLKTRFKYKEVKPNNFGLSTLEILASDDKDLNQYVSMKKLAPYRDSEWKVTRHRIASKDSILGGPKKEGRKDKSSKKSSSGDLVLGGLKKEGKKDKSGKKSSSGEGTCTSEAEKDKAMNELEETDVNTKSTKSTRSNRRKRRKEDLKISTDRLEAYGKILKRHKSH